MRKSLTEQVVSRIACNILQEALRPEDGWRFLYPNLLPYRDEDDNDVYDEGEPIGYHPDLWVDDAWGTDPRDKVIPIELLPPGLESTEENPVEVKPTEIDPYVRPTFEHDPPSRRPKGVPLDPEYIAPDFDLEDYAKPSYTPLSIPHPPPEPGPGESVPMPLNPRDWSPWP